MPQENLQIPFGSPLASWLEMYRAGRSDPRLAIESLALQDSDPAWITRQNKERLDAQLGYLSRRLDEVCGDLRQLSLYGIPFAVKDNIDVAGWPTTAACPSFSYIAQSDATVVSKLRHAGAIVVGKTNLDQFATGLVGTRSPYGAVPNTFRPEYISGGSSSGSASVVARGIVPFALGTDTAGSGRIPAGLNNIVGLKPTRGWLSTSGVVPACRTLDCVSILALTVADAACIAEIAGGYDASDPYSRLQSISVPAGFPERPRFGVPEFPEFFGDAESASAYARALGVAQEMGVDIVLIDFAPFAALASLLYEGPWIAERFVIIESLLKENPDAIDPSVRRIVEGASRFSAIDMFKSEYRRADLTRLIEKTMTTVDAIMVPTAPTVYTIKEVLAEPIKLNARLGVHTNFANFADLCALALPGGMRGDGLPAGITLLAPAWHDHALAKFGVRWQKHRFQNGYDVALGATKRKYVPAEPEPDPPLRTTGTFRIAVVGAHLRGMPLNHQLTSRGASFVESTFTSKDYRLFALAGTNPAKPGLMRVVLGEAGGNINVELWDIPSACLGSFLAEIPPPLGIGSITLSDGRVVKGFICEPYALIDAEDITEFGGWCAYISSLKPEVGG